MNNPAAETAGYQKSPLPSKEGIKVEGIIGQCLWTDSN